VVTRSLLLVLLAGCSSVELMPPMIRMRTGPANARPLKRVVAVPATCGSLGMESVQFGKPELGMKPRECDRIAVEGADQVIRVGLSFRGLDVIDSENVNARTAERHETRTTQADIDPQTGVARRRETSIESETVGARFEDATPIEQAQILADLRADAVLSARIWISSSPGISMRRTVIAQVQLLATSDRALVWSRRCEVEVGGLMTTDAVAVEQAARCAIAGWK
jgi:hypothetical protein